MLAAGVASWQGASSSARGAGGRAFCAARNSSTRCAQRGPQQRDRAVITRVASPEADTAVDAVAAQRQTYIQDSINFSGAELAARLPSMQAALRAQRGGAAGTAAAAGAAAAAAFSGMGGAGGANALPRDGGGPVAPVPTATRAGSPAFGDDMATAAYGSAVPLPALAPAWGSSGSGSGSGIAAFATATPPASQAVQELTFAPDTSPISGGDFAGAGAGGMLPPPAAAEQQPQQQQQAELPPPAPLPPAALDPYSPSSMIGAWDTEPGPDPLLSMSGNLQGLSASEKLQALKQVQQVSNKALTKVAVASSTYYANAPKTIDIRMYDQLVAAHNKLSQKFSDTNAHIAVLEERLNASNEDLIAAFELMKQIAMEFGTTSRLAQSTAAAVQFGVDPQDALDKITKLQERLKTLEQAVLEQREEFGKRVVRKVPVEWIGVASEVKIMGDFDDWTRGEDLSAEDVASDSVYSRFEGVLTLRPGTYKVKFLVDQEWRLAADWPTGKDQHGNDVCLLTVT